MGSPEENAKAFSQLRLSFLNAEADFNEQITGLFAVYEVERTSPQKLKLEAEMYYLACVPGQAVGLPQERIWITTLKNEGQASWEKALDQFLHLARRAGAWLPKEIFDQLPWKPAEPDLRWLSLLLHLLPPDDFDVETNGRTYHGIRLMFDGATVFEASAHVIDCCELNTTHPFLDCIKNGRVEAKRTEKRTKSKKITVKVPRNPKVIELARLLAKKKGAYATKLEVAMELTNGDRKAAKSLLRQLERFPDLLPPDIDRGQKTDK